MQQSLRFVGLDCHADTIEIAIAEAGRQPAQRLGRVANDAAAVLKQLRRLGRKEQLVICYEAGPTGFGLCRHLRQQGDNCVVVAPSLVPHKPGQRVKTDRRDAAQLAHFLRSGDLTTITVPDEATEAMRDLVRARDDARKAERAARHQLQKFLLRHDRHYGGGTNWTVRHREWIGQQTFVHDAQRRVLLDYLHTVQTAAQRVAALTKDIEAVVVGWHGAPLVAALQACRGVDLLVAVTTVAELGDLRRFASPRQLMAYLGVVPSEHSSGQRRRQGGITKTGNGHVRRVLTEAAWAYRFPARLSKRLAQRNRDLPPAVQAIAWKAQQRLCRKFHVLTQKGKPVKVVVTAIARELVGYLWAIAHAMPVATAGASAGASR